MDEQASEGVNKVMEILKYMYIVQQWGGQVGSEGWLCDWGVDYASEGLSRRKYDEFMGQKG